MSETGFSIGDKIVPPTPDKPEQQPQCKKEAEAKGFTVDDTCYPWFPTPNKAQQPAAHSPLASFDKLVKATTGKATGAYQLQVGDLFLRSEEWHKAKAEKWMPVIVRAVNNADKLAEALRKFTNAYRLQSEHDLECAEAEASKALAAYEAAQ